MPLLVTIVIFAILGSVVSLIGGVFLLFQKERAQKLSLYLAAFAAGTLLGTAFLDLIPEALEAASSPESIATWILIGLLLFFVLERLIHWFHHHHYADHEHHNPESAPAPHSRKPAKAIVPLILIGDSVHNFIDGIAIAASFIADPALGVLTALAVGAHEIPQEIGDFGILLRHGFPRKKIWWFNFLTALTALLGALLTYFFRAQLEGILPVVLALTAGLFIYIAASDLIPEIHSHPQKRPPFSLTITLLAGAFLVGLFVRFFE